MDALSPRSPEVRPTATSLGLSGWLGFDGWRDVGVRLSRYSNASTWWLGDWLVFGRTHYRERYKAGVAATGLEYQTLRNYAVVARRFRPSRRRDELSFGHHAEVCALPDDDQDFWLDVATQSRWSRAELRRRVRAERGRGREPAVVIRLLLDGARSRRWREAAGASDHGLDDWITAVLDREAATVLEELQASRL